MQVEAEISDATHLVLTRPLALPVGSKVLVEIVEQPQSVVREEMLFASGALLERAYGADEPDYSGDGEPL